MTIELKCSNEDVDNTKQKTIHLPAVQMASASRVGWYIVGGAGAQFFPRCPDANQACPPNEN